MSATDTMTRPLLVFVPEAALITGEHENTLRNRAANGTIPGAVRIGRRWAWPRAMFMSFLGLAPLTNVAEAVCRG